MNPSGPPCVLDVFAPDNVPTRDLDGDHVEARVDASEPFSCQVGLRYGLDLSPLPGGNGLFRRTPASTRSGLHLDERQRAVAACDDVDLATT